MRKAILYIATSPDDYIAASGDGLSFLSAKRRKGYAYEAFIAKVDTVIMGVKDLL